jgi:hypothetical protein
VTPQDSAARRFYRLLGWLLTPLVAWAVSFLAGWIGAAMFGSVRGLVGWSVTGAAVGVVGWVVAMRWWGAGERRKEKGEG